MNTEFVTIRGALRSKIPFLIVTAFLPLSLFLNAGFISVGIIWFFVLCIVNWDFSQGLPVKRFFPLVFPILLLLLYIVAVLYSEDKSEALRVVIKKIHLLLVPLGFMMVNKKFTESEFQVILLIFAFACVAASLLCYSNAIINIIQNRTIYYPSVYKLYYFSYTPLTEPVGITPIYLSMYANLAFIIIWTSPLLKDFLKTVLAVYMGIFVILIAAKVGLIILGIIVPAFIVMRSNKSQLLTWVFLLVLTVSFVFIVLQLPFLKERFVTATQFDYGELDGTVWNSTTLRLAIWSSAIDAIKSNPLFGYGPGDAQSALEHAYREKGFVWGLLYKENPGISQYNPHNEFLSAMLDVGVGGLVILLLLTTVAFKYAITHKNLLLFGFMTIILFSFLVESVLFRQKGIVFFVFFYSLFFWHETKRSES